VSARRLPVVQPRAGTSKEQRGALGADDLRHLCMAGVHMGGARLCRDINAVLHDSCDRALRVGYARWFAVLVRRGSRVRPRDTDAA